jgi:hypothetical protein
VIVIPSYAGGWDWKDHSSGPAQAKKYAQPHLNGKKLGMVVMPVIPVMVGRLKWEDYSSGPTGQKVRPYLQND